MNIPYRTQRFLKRALVVALIAVLVLALALACWMVWVQRFLVYTADGKVKLDFNLPPVTGGQLAQKPDEPDIPIHFDKDGSDVEVTTELKQMLGYYVDAEALQDMEAVKTQVALLEPGTAVMLDVKGIYGDFYYSSAVGEKRNSKIDPAKMDELIDFVDSHGMYMIARFPALRDYIYGLHHVPDGVHHSSGRYLYQDDKGCYWLHPSSNGTLNFLMQIIMELRERGFDEVVMYDFQFPDTEDTNVKGDKAQMLTKAANTLVSACATEKFAVSFVKTADFTLPKGRVRMYMEGLDATQAMNAASSSGIENTAVNLVFITDLYDTRFDVYSVLRPLSGAH